jgi:hypothetical protein
MPASIKCMSTDRRGNELLKYLNLHSLSYKPSYRTLEVGLHLVLGTSVPSPLEVWSGR